MEALLHYCWKHRLLPLTDRLLTTDGRRVEVIDVGIHNNDAGPDFFNAKIRLDGDMLVGNVEIHIRSREWFQHGHDSDPAYDNVILHVVSEADCDVVTTSNHRRLPQLVISVPQRIEDNYRELLSIDRYPPCHKIIPTLPRLVIHSWMAALQTERLQQKTEAITGRLHLLEESWEHAYFVTLARNFGFGVNSDAFELWARNMPLSAVVHHRDNLLQVEAMFLGQAGLLNDSPTTEMGDYYRQLHNEYTYLRNKFSLTPIDPRCWKFMRMRPQNFPHIRLAQLARLYHEGRTNLARLLECDSVKDVARLLNCGVSDFWETHYTFGKESARKAKCLSPASITVLTINTFIPTLFAYGRYSSKEHLCDRAFDLLEQLKPEDNNIVRLWKESGLTARSAGDSQALIQLRKQYCDRKDCLRCRIGYEYMKAKAPQPPKTAPQPPRGEF